MVVVDSENVPIEGPKPRRLADMAGVERDLNWTASALSILARREDRHRLDMILLEALHDTALIRYARCFRKGLRHAFLIPQIWIEELTPELRQMHTCALDIRDKHIAHSVNDWELNIPVAQIITSRKFSASSVRAISIQHLRVVMLGIASIRQMQQLATTLAQRVSEAGTELRREIYRELQGVSPKEIRRRAPPLPQPGRRAPGTNRRR